MNGFAIALAMTFGMLASIADAAQQTPAPASAPSPEPAASATPALAPEPTPAPSESAEFRTILRTTVRPPTPSPTLPPCATAKISPAETIGSKEAEPGKTFRFNVTSVDDPLGEFKTIAPGAVGYGVVSVVRRARAGGDPGLLVLESRYIVAADGAHVPVSLLRTVNGLFLGHTNNSPGLLGLIPYVGYATSLYDAIHKGGETGTGPADSLIVLLGDDAIAGTCLPPPPPSPAK
jgi:hypothetical protein